MKKRFKNEGPSADLPPQPDVAGIVSKMQQQLFSIERKIDALAGQSSRPPQSFERPLRRYGEGRHGGDFRDKERQLFKVICADCNRECEVPFRPSGDRPVYCKECFSSRKGGGNSFREKQELRFDKDKRGHSEARGFDKKKKPFSTRRKKRK